MLQSNLLMHGQELWGDKWVNVKDMGELNMFRYP